MLTEENMRESQIMPSPTPESVEPAVLETAAFDIGRVALVGLFVLACFFALHEARTVFMPIILALLFGLLLAPVIRFLKQYHVPEPLSAALVLVAVGSVVGYGVYRLSEPAGEWFAKAPARSVRSNISLAPSRNRWRKWGRPRHWLKK